MIADCESIKLAVDHLAHNAPFFYAFNGLIVLRLGAGDRCLSRVFVLGLVLFVVVLIDIKAGVWRMDLVGGGVWT